MQTRIAPARIAAALALTGLVAAFTPAAAQTNITVKPTGKYAQIDTKLAIQAMKDLGSADATVRSQAAKSVQSAPERYAPPVFYALSQTLMAQGDPQRAMFWFYAGQLRGRFDANRCADITARQAIAVLNERYGAPINQYAFQRMPLLKKTVRSVVTWDRKTPHNYDHRWINLHGMGAFTGASGSKPQASSLPESEWNAIAEKTRQDYLSGFEEVMEKVRRGELKRATPEK